MSDAIDWLMTSVFLPFVVILMLGLVVALPVVLFQSYQDSQRPTFSLTKDDWSCTLISTYTTNQMVLVGKVMIPQLHTHNDCIQWSHK